MNVTNVKLHFSPSTDPTEISLAPNQHIYIDLTIGTMTRVRSDARGTIVHDGSAPASASGATQGASVSGPVTLDDARTYQVVVSPIVMSPAPGTAMGVAAQVRAGKLVVPPHIAIRLTTDGTTAATAVRCILTVASADTTVTSSGRGWVMSNDRRAGVVTIRSTSRLIKLAADPTPTATLAIAPTAVVRGQAGTITATPPTGPIGFKVTQWKYEIAHTNPATTSPSTATVNRPATESPTTFDQNWQGTLCASGTVKVKFVTGATLRATGDAAVSATVLALDPVEITLAATVAPRTGSAWQTGLVENAEAGLNQPIATFHNTGRHNWNGGAWSVNPTPAVPSGPNRGCIFVDNAAVSFTSSPSINTLITNASSTFSLAQDKAYLLSPLPVRVIPRHLYTIGSGGAITITNSAAFATWAGLGPGASYRASNHCIDQPRLLSGTRRHEYVDANASHKANCLKALRALEPVKFAEALVKLPGASLNIGGLFSARVSLVSGVAATHDVVDETATRSDNAIRFISGQQIQGVNSDASGNLIGPVWNPATNSMLT